MQNRTGTISLSRLQNNKGIYYDKSNDIWTIPYYGKEVKIQGGRDNGEVIPIYFDDIYSNLPVKGKTVIDVGANIGDSSIYFALLGAEKVISIEPLPKNFEIARKNILLNNLANKIDLLLAGCSPTSGTIVVDATYQEIGACVMTGSKRENSTNGVTIPLLTLKNIRDRGRVLSEDAILKIDCEGCEYDVILSANKEELRLFSHILIEYHYGYRRLKQKLQICGFEVSITKPVAHRRDYLYEFSEDKWMYNGYIYAQRNASK